MSDTTSRWSVAIFGDSRRTGPRSPGERIRALAVFGDSTVDLRSSPADDEIEIRAVAVFGDVHILVDPGARVDLSGVALFGDNRNALAQPDSPPVGPLVRVDALSLFGDVKVR